MTRVSVPSDIGQVASIWNWTIHSETGVLTLVRDRSEGIRVLVCMQGGLEDEPVVDAVMQLCQTKLIASLDSVRICIVADRANTPGIRNAGDVFEKALADKRHQSQPAQHLSMAVKMRLQMYAHSNYDFVPVLCDAADYILIEVMVVLL